MEADNIRIHEILQNKAQKRILAGIHWELKLKSNASVMTVDSIMPDGSVTWWKTKQTVEGSNADKKSERSESAKSAPIC